MKKRTKPVIIPPAPGMYDYHDFSKPEVLREFRAALAQSTLKEGHLPEGISESFETVIGNSADNMSAENDSFLSDSNLNSNTGVRIVKLTVSGADHEKLIFHIHGGAWIGGVPCSGQQTFVDLIDDLKVDLVSIEYGLAPEHPFPEGLMDCVSAYKAILAEGYDPENILFMGESAGGNLCLALGHYIKDHSLPMPAGMVLISPAALEFKIDELEERLKKHPHNLKLSESIETAKMYLYGTVPGGDADVPESGVGKACGGLASRNGNCSLAGNAEIDSLAKKINPQDPYLAPICGDFTKFPPVLVQFGSCDFIVKDSVELTYKMMRAGVDVTSHCWRFMPHVFVLIPEIQPEAALALEEIKDFVRRILNLRSRY